MKKLTKIRIKYFFIVICLLIILRMILPTFMRYYTDVTADVVGYAKETRTSSYKVKFHANGGEGIMDDLIIPYGSAQKLTPNAFVFENYSFGGWNTEPDGSGTAYGNENELNIDTFVPENEINLYAQWIQGVAMIVENSTVYSTLQKAIDAVPTDNTETTVKLFADVSEVIKIEENKNIIFDLQNYTITNNGENPVISNNGKITISNGTIKTFAGQGAINNNTNAVFTMSGGKVIATGTRQAIYNKGGKVIIKGDAYLIAESKERATVQNVAKSELYIEGGIIISKNYHAIQNAGILQIGVKDGIYNEEHPWIQAELNGLNTSAKFDYYDGTIFGRTSEAISNKNYVNDKEVEYEVVFKTTTIDDKTYNMAHLESEEFYTVTFDATGGIVDEKTRSVSSSKKIGILPAPIKEGYAFKGWYTQESGGKLITTETQITNSITYYAQWTDKCVAQIDDKKFGTIQEAINTIKDDDNETTIKVLQDTNEKLITINKQNIILDMQNHTIGNKVSNAAVISNWCKLLILNGILKSDGDTATIDNKPGGNLTVRGGKIIATGSRQSIYNESGSVLNITSGAYLESSAIEKPNNSELLRGTIQNLKGGTVNITGGTIIGNRQQAISNEGTLNIGVQDGNINNTEIVIKGKTYGVVNVLTFNYYDGIIKGVTQAISGDITKQETNSQIVDSTEDINGEIYFVKYLTL